MNFKLYFFGVWMVLLKIVAIVPSHSIRRILYWILKFSYSRSSTVYGGLEIRKPQNVLIDRNTIIGHNCILDGRRGILIGKNVNLSSEVSIWTLQHDPQDEQFGTKGGKVIIEDYVWLSFRSVVLPGVTVGKGAVVAAGSIVTKDVTPWTIVGGIPAKKIGERNDQISYKLGKNAIPFI